MTDTYSRGSAEPGSNAGGQSEPVRQTDDARESTSSPPAKASRPRDAYLDNAKGLLIVLVVIGHAIEQAHGTRAEALYVMIYSFHMPAFVFITGYLTRGFTPTVRNYVKIVTNFIVPYLIFQTIHRVFSTVLQDEEFTLRLLVPEWTLWFLLAIAWWRAATPLLRRIPHKVPIAVAISLGAGFLPELTSTLALNRTLTLLPFFVMGLSLRPEHIDLIKAKFSRVSGFIGFGLLGILALGIQGAVPDSTFYYDASFGELSGDFGEGILFRLATLTTGVIGTCAVLAVVPTAKTWWTYLGRWSMYVYILHGLILHPLRELDLVNWMSSWVQVLLVAGGAVILALVLASWPVRTVTKPVVQPPLNGLVDKLP